MDTFHHRDREGNEGERRSQSDRDTEANSDRLSRSDVVAGASSFETNATSSHPLERLRNDFGGSKSQIDGQRRSVDKLRSVDKRRRKIDRKNGSVARQIGADNSADMDTGTGPDTDTGTDTNTDTDTNAGTVNESGSNDDERALSIGPTDDILEREADRVAADIVTASAITDDRTESKWSPAKPVGPPAPTGRRVGAERIHPDATRRSNATSHRFDSTRKGDGDSIAPAVVDDVIRSPGRALNPRVRRSMEGMLGTDLRSVRIHTGPKAADSAAAIDARAYTVGTDIVFDRGEYDPHTPEGRGVLAHELTHTVQQQSGVPVVRRLPKFSFPGRKKEKKDTLTRTEGLADSYLSMLERHYPEDPSEIPNCKKEITKSKRKDYEKRRKAFLDRVKKARTKSYDSYKYLYNEIGEASNAFNATLHTLEGDDDGTPWKTYLDHFKAKVSELKSWHEQHGRKSKDSTFRSDLKDMGELLSVVESNIKAGRKEKEGWKLTRQFKKALPDTKDLKHDKNMNILWAIGYLEDFNAKYKYTLARTGTRGFTPPESAGGVGSDGGGNRSDAGGKTIEADMLGIEDELDTPATTSTAAPTATTATAQQSAAAASQPSVGSGLDQFITGSGSQGATTANLVTTPPQKAAPVGPGAISSESSSGPDPVIGNACREIEQIAWSIERLLGTNDEYKNKDQQAVTNLRAEIPEIRFRSQTAGATGTWAVSDLLLRARMLGTTAMAYAHQPGDASVKDLLEQADRAASITKELSQKYPGYGLHSTTPPTKQRPAPANKLDVVAGTYMTYDVSYAAAGVGGLSPLYTYWAIGELSSLPAIPLPMEGAPATSALALFFNSVTGAQSLHRIVSSYKKRKALLGESLVSERGQRIQEYAIGKKGRKMRWNTAMAAICGAGFVISGVSLGVSIAALAGGISAPLALVFLPIVVGSGAVGVASLAYTSGRIGNRAYKHTAGARESFTGAAKALVDTYYAQHTSAGRRKRTGASGSQGGTMQDADQAREMVERYANTDDPMGMDRSLLENEVRIGMQRDFGYYRQYMATEIVDMLIAGKPSEQYDAARMLTALNVYRPTADVMPHSILALANEKGKAAAIEKVAFRLKS